MPFLKSTLALLLVVSVPCTLAEEPWGYFPPVGPANWTSLGYPTCGGHRQSPINIQTSQAVYASSLASLQFVNYDQPSGNTTIVNITNNGHSAYITFTMPANASGPQYMLTNGNLSSAGYALDNIHFHWASNDSSGSEHTIDGKPYAMEIHFVHYREDLGSVNGARAAGVSDGLAVVSVMVQISASGSSNFDALVDDLHLINYRGDNVHFSSTFMPSSLLPTDRSVFYRYPGSLTSPGCNEDVVWTVFKTPITISSAQLEQFRELKENPHSSPDEEMTINFRPVQALNGRTVYSSINPPTTAPVTTTPKSSGNGASTTFTLIFASLIAVFLVTMTSQPLSTSV